jgi:uncharacterized protein (UPF0335 family)
LPPQLCVALKDQAGAARKQTRRAGRLKASAIPESLRRSQVFKELKQAGYDRDTVRALVRRRKMNEEQRAAADALMDQSNIARRNLNKGQQAILLARIFPDSHQGKKNEAFTTSAEMAEVSHRRLRDAREIVRRGADLADQGPA